MELSEITVNEKIGNGSFGNVFKVKTDHKGAYAVKIISSVQCNFLEPIIMCSVNHPYINHSILSLSNNEYTFIFQTLAHCDLLKWRSHNNINMPQFKAWSYQIVKGLNFLHNQDIIHGDIKPQNILLYDNGNVKISDFGKSVFIEKTKNYNITGTQSYCAPECISSDGWSLEIDIFSLGCSLWQIYYGKLLFPHQDENSYEAHFNCLLDWQEEILNQRTSYYHFEIPYKKYQYNKNFPDSELFEFLIPMLQWKIEGRASSSELLNAPFISKLNQKIDVSISRSKNICKCDSQHNKLYNCIKDKKLPEKIAFLNENLFCAL